MIGKIFEKLRERQRNFGSERSPKWEETKIEFAKTHPKICPVCGTTKKIELHHIWPFHLYPKDELSFPNLMWLCREHHHEWGHLFDWKSWNETVRQDTSNFNLKVSNRP